MLGLFKKKKVSEEIKKDRDRSLNEMMRRADELKKFVSDNRSGWSEFCVMLENYIESCKKRKAITALDMADQETIKQLMLLDHEVFILSFVLKMPGQFIRNVEEKAEKANKEDTNGTIGHGV